MEQKISVKTERLMISPLSNEEMKQLIEAEPDEGMKQAYTEMLEGCEKNPGKRIWNAIWTMRLKNDPSISVGDLSFKGLNSNGMV